jgi:spore germination protein KB
MSIEKGMISSRQTIFLITNVIFATEIQFIPALLTRYAGQDAWVAVLLAAVLGLLLGALVIHLGLRFPRQNVVEYGTELLGKWGGRVLGMILGLFFLYVAGIILRELGDHLVTAIMPETPLVVLNALFAIAIAYGVYLGLEVFARVSEILFPTFLIMGLVGALFLIPQLNFELLKPAFVHPPMALLRSSMNIHSFYGEGIAILFLIPCMRHSEQAPRINLKVTALLTIPLILLVVMEIAMFGAPETSRMISPTLELAKMISIGGFLERIESFLLALWITLVALKVMLLYYVALLSFAQVFNLCDYRPLVLPGAIILVSLSMLVFTDVTQTREFLSTSWNIFAITLETGIPIVLYILALVRKKGTTRQGGVYK